MVRDNGNKTFARVTNSDIINEIKDVKALLQIHCSRIDVLEEREDNTRKGLYALGAASTAAIGWLARVFGK